MIQSSGKKSVAEYGNKRKSKHLFEYLAKEGAKTDRAKKEYELNMEKLNL